jgi:hypothetical protein
MPALSARSDPARPKPLINMWVRLVRLVRLVGGFLEAFYGFALV